jgi:hypothetical protein
MISATTRRATKLADRLFALPQLLQTRRWSQKELMDHLGVDRKTIISDINALSNSDPPLPGSAGIHGQAEVRRRKKSNELSNFAAVERYIRRGERAERKNPTCADDLRLLKSSQRKLGDYSSPTYKHRKISLGEKLRFFPPQIPCCRYE